MQSIMEKISADPFIRRLTALAAESGGTVYLTGGGLRDALIGRQVKDLDFAVAPCAEELPALFARRIGGTFFWLDQEKRQSRVAKRTGGGHLTFDFAPLRGVNIEEDLSLRDFTINAMALELAEGKTLIDPLKGEEDLRKKLIRRCSAASFTDDPLRLLRTVRLAAQLDFRIEAETLHDMTGKALLLEKMAAERKRDEFLKILDCPGLEKSLALLQDTWLLAVLIPAEVKSGFDRPALDKAIRAASRVEETLLQLPAVQPDRFRRVASHFMRGMEGEITAASLAKLAAFAGTRPGSADAWSSRLRLGRKAARMLTLLSTGTKALFANLGDSPAQRPMFRFFRDHEPAGLELALLALSRDEVSRSCWLRLAGYYFSEYDAASGDLLLSGKEVMELLGMREGVAVGEMMEMLRGAESRGVVGNKDEARTFLLKNVLTKEAPVL